MPGRGPGALEHGRAGLLFLTASLLSVLAYFAVGEPFPSLIGPGFPGFIEGPVPSPCLFVSRGGATTVQPLHAPFPQWPQKETRQYLLQRFPLVSFDQAGRTMEAGRLGRNMHVLRAPGAPSDTAFLCEAAKADALHFHWGDCRSPAEPHGPRDRLVCRRP